MMHFFEKLERELNFQKEYEKLERMFAYEIYPKGRIYGDTIEDCVEREFRRWSKRGNYTSFKEIRNQLGFEYSKNFHDHIMSLRRDINIETFLLYCEMLCNILIENRWFSPNSMIQEGIRDILDTLKYDVDKAGFEIKKINNDYMIVEKNAVSFEVADAIPEIADAIIEYNHYILRGDIQRKRELLKNISDSVEPRRSELNRVNKSATDDFFWMVNNMNIRHNNCDSSDPQRYNEKFASLTIIEKEEWYDVIYEQALMLFVLLKYSDRKEKIHDFKGSITNFM